MHMHFDSSLKGYNAHVKFIVHTSHVIAKRVLTFCLCLLHFLSTCFEGVAVHRLLRDQTIFNPSLKS